ncbi:helix-turn-helix domain-containing protein [Kitasatospora sp. NPDC001603]|uniref:helix-turn-helix domain-containing protein n=1 Tax=Kitasatospora sp. NPDC001603 TaxID=3154388 RepID=UPI0033176915
MGERDELARLLGELKSRSGLSYGALAKRLHLSTSTLHRYCTGDVVPTEFAPLDLLARLCRATPEELVELYRLWVIVHAARGSRTSPESGPADPAEARTEAATPIAPVAPVISATPVAPVVPVTSVASDPGGAVEVGPVVADRVGPDPVPGAAQRLRRVRRRGILAAVTVTAVLAAVGAVATGLESSAGSPAPGADDSPSASAPVSAPAPVSASDPASPSAGAGPGSPGPTGGADTSPPFTVSVRPSGRDTACDQYVVDRPPSEVPRPPELPDVADWVSRVGAVPGHYQSIEVVVQGTGKDTVVLSKLNVRVVRIGPPLAWNAYSMGEGCGSGVDVHSYDLDLDAARPRAVVTEGSTGLPVKVSENDPEVIEVSAETTSHEVSWYLELEWSSGDRKGTVPVDLGHGTPFRTSAVKGRPLFVYPIGGHAWEPSPFQR